MKITCETTTQDLKLVQSVVDRLEEEVEQLTDACAEKDDELEKLKTWKAEMMAVAMGPSFAEPTSRRANRESRARKSSIAPVRQQPKRKSAMKSDDVARPKGTIDLQSFTSTALEDAANASFGSSESGERNGSTPKRAKTQLSLKSAGVRTPYKPKPKLARPSGIQEMHTRAALGAISPNRRHTTVGFALSKDGECDEGDLDTKRRGSLQFGTQASFDMNETLASSPFTPGKVMCGTGKDPEDEEAEDDTAEL